ncbi:MAG: ATP synthase subunit I [Halofilum sp. (in: g-proteobacteria)]|nr:ATP synthase subunit I [Halofilum sp. (in: g-proteobacteria)]
MAHRSAAACAAQAAVGGAGAALAAAAAGEQAALASAAAGRAGRHCCRSAWFAVARVSTRRDRGGRRRRCCGRMYLGEAIKLAAIAVIFVGIFRVWPEVPPLPLILTFVAVQTVHWFAPLLLES